MIYSLDDYVGYKSEEDGYTHETINAQQASEIDASNLSLEDIDWKPLGYELETEVFV